MSADTAAGGAGVLRRLLGARVAAASVDAVRARDRVRGVEISGGVLDSICLLIPIKVSCNVIFCQI